MAVPPESKRSEVSSLSKGSDHVVCECLGVEFGIRMGSSLPNEKDIVHQEVLAVGLHRAEAAHFEGAEINEQLQSFESLGGNEDARNPSRLKTGWFDGPFSLVARQEYCLGP